MLDHMLPLAYKWTWKHLRGHGKMKALSGTWKTGDVCEIVGVQKQRIMMWLKRGLPLAYEMSGGGTPGKHREFTFRNLMELAVARAAVDAGVPTEIAFRAAAKFAYSTSHKQVDGGLEVLREQGFPFPAPAETYVIIHGGDFTIGDEASLSMPLAKSDSVTVVNAGRVFSGVIDRLGLDPQKVLVATYERHPITLSAD